MNNVGDRLRPMTADDLETVLAWRNHPQVRRCMFSSGEIAPDEHAAWFARASVDTDRMLLIFERDGDPSGFVSFDGTAKGGVVDWGFYLAPEAPRGTGAVLGRHALDYAFVDNGFHKVCGRVIGFNRRSAAFHLKLGFQQEGILREQHFDGSCYHDVVCFGMLGVEWLRAERD